MYIHIYINGIKINTSSKKFSCEKGMKQYQVLKYTQSIMSIP